MRPVVTAFPLSLSTPWEAARWRPAGSAACVDATDPTRHPGVDQDATAAMTAVSARIAVVDVTDDTTANHRAEDRAEDSANTRTTAAHASIVTTRRRTARIGYRDRLRTRRHRTRVIRDRRLSNGLLLGLRDCRWRLGLNDLRRRLRSRLVVSHLVRRGNLLGRRSG